MDEHIQALVSIAAREAGIQEADFRELDEGGGDRHGLWEWCWVTERRSRHLYVSLAVLDTSPIALEFEAWADAQQGTRFGRMFVGRTQVGPILLQQGLAAVFPHLLMEGRAEGLVALLRTAKERALSFPRREMTGLYPLARRRRGPEQ